MTVRITNPLNGLDLREEGATLRDAEGNSFPVVNGVPRICEASNYTENFGRQWNIFTGTQIDRPEEGQSASADRFFRTTAWTPAELAGLDILEVGSGAGRFSRVVLEQTQARLWSIDYSSAVEANFRNNAHFGHERFQLFQGSIYEMPFPDDSFDKVFCMGVLQHTPDFAASVRALIAKAKPGGEIVVDFYAIRNALTKLNAKYLLRPLTKRMSHDRLLGAIEANAGWMIGLSRALNRIGLHALTRFVPICDVAILPPDIPQEELREWVVLDTFDMFSPEFDNPQRIRDVAEMFRGGGATVTFADYVPIGPSRAAVVRATKNPR